MGVSRIAAMNARLPRKNRSAESTLRTARCFSKLANWAAGWRTNANGASAKRSPSAASRLKSIAGGHTNGTPMKSI